MSGVSRAGLPNAAGVWSWCMPRVRSRDGAGQSSALPFVLCSNRGQASLKRGREEARDGRCLLERGWFRALEDPGRHEAFARLPSGKLAMIGGTSRTCTRDSRWPPGGLAPLLAGRQGAGRGDVVLAVPPVHRGDACALQVLGPRSRRVARRCVFRRGPSARLIPQLSRGAYPSGAEFCVWKNGASSIY